MRFVLMFKNDTLATSRERRPPEVLWDVSPNHKAANTLVFQANIWWNEIENNAMKTHL